MKYCCCYSGGHSSALVAIEAVRKYGKENVILLNHDISPEVEHSDIKRFKNEVAAYLDIPITYANMPNWETMTPLRVAKDLSGFQFQVGQALCTYNLKTKPFYAWLKDNFPVPGSEHDGSWYEATHPNELMNEDVTILYGFDLEEKHRIQRRSQILGTMGYHTDFPLAFWERTIFDTEEVGIKKPETYKIFKHANCVGCLKSGRQHWYIVYCLYPNIFAEALEAEAIIGHSIIKGVYLEELVPTYEAMKQRGIVPNDKEQSQTFWAKVRRKLGDDPDLPCECTEGSIRRKPLF